VGGAAWTEIGTNDDKIKIDTRMEREMIVFLKMKKIIIF
jgi:hypothetical protein